MNQRLKQAPLTLILWSAMLLSACAGLAKAREEDALSADEHMRLGSSYEDQSLGTEAAKEYAAALRRQKNHLPALMALGNVAFQNRDLIEAEIYYRKVLKLVPGHVGANNNLAMVFLVRGSRLEIAEILVKTALQQAGPFRPYVLDTLANVYMRQGRYPEARMVLDEAESICSPADTLLHDHLAQSRRQCRLHEQFVARRRKLIEADDWKLSSRQERKAKINALKMEFRQREQWMKQDYVQRREALWSGKDPSFATFVP